MTVATARQEKGPWRREFRATLTLAWPLVLTNLSMSVIGATDVLMLGWLGASELAASSLAVTLFMLMMIFCIGLITASSPMMASELGRKPNSVRDIRRTFRQSLWTALLICLPVWAILWHTQDILLFFGQIPELAEKAQSYMRAYMWSILPVLWTISMRNFLSVLERPIWSLIVGILGIFANILFNYALIFGNFGMPRLGLVGAGISSVLANSVMFMGMVAVIHLHPVFRRYHLFGRWWRSDWTRFFEMWKLGFPIAISFGLEAGVFSIAVMLMGLISEQAVAAHAIALQIATVTFMVPMGLAQAATVRVGIGYGRSDPSMIHRAGWTSFMLGTGFMTVMALIIVTFPGPLIALFLQGDSAENIAVAALAAQFLIVAAAFQIVDGAQVVGQGMLRGLHDTRVPMIFSGFGYWVIGIGAGWWLAFRQGYEGVGLWAGLAIGLFIVAVLVIARWCMRGKIGLLPS